MFFLQRLDLNIILYHRRLDQISSCCVVSSYLDYATTGLGLVQVNTSAKFTYVRSYWKKH